jgi:hypothetical protein
MQHETGPIAIECHDRCARYHILALHFQRDQAGFSIALEEQLLMNSAYAMQARLKYLAHLNDSTTKLERVL